MIKIANKANPQGPDAERREDRKINVLRGLLSFYSNRTTSFASLFVASIFGLVSFLGLAHQIVQKPDINLWAVALSLIPYLIFFLAGFHTFSRYTYYAEIAHMIEAYGLRIPYDNLLSEVGCKEGDEDSNLSASIGNIYRRQRESRIEKIPRNRILPFLYIVLCISLAILVYYPAILRLIEHLMAIFFAT